MTVEVIEVTGQNRITGSFRLRKEGGLQGFQRGICLVPKTEGSVFETAA